MRVKTTAATQLGPNMIMSRLDLAEPSDSSSLPGTCGSFSFFREDKEELSRHLTPT